MARLRLTARAATALRGVCGVAALLGLFAMHGLGAHGATHQQHAAEPMVADTMVMVSVDHGAAEPETGGAPDHPAPDPGLLGLAGWCLAVLLLGVVLARVLGAGSRRHARRDSAASVVGHPARARRDRDPPCLLALSVQRC